MEEKITEKVKPEVVEYEKPRVVDYGDLVELTAGQSSGSALDASFPVGTPFDDLTFS
jgi:hypothetical protein